jgi:hypothetical protein
MEVMMRRRFASGAINAAPVAALGGTANRGLRNILSAARAEEARGR